MIVLERTAQQIVVEDAVSAYPAACYGFLFGYEEESGRRIITHARAMAPENYLQAQEYATKQQLQLLGVYCSHPDQHASPSARDQAAAQPYLSYLIIPLNDGKPGYIRCWRLNADGYFEEENNDLLAL